MSETFVVVRIRGKTGMRKDTKQAMQMIRLYNKNHCVLLENTKPNHGTLKKIKDYITWGEIDEPTLHELLQKRGRLPGNKPLTEAYLKEKIKLSVEEFSKELVIAKKKMKDVPGLKSFFRLKPPQGGFERGGIKKHFSLGGVLGYRGTKINQLIKRML